MNPGGEKQYVIRRDDGRYLGEKGAFREDEMTARRFTSEPRARIAIARLPKSDRLSSEIQPRENTHG